MLRLQNPPKPRRSARLSTVLIGMQLTLKLLFNKFMDEQEHWVSSQKIDPRQCGILLPFRKVGQRRPGTRCCRC